MQIFGLNLLETCVERAENLEKQINQTTTKIDEKIRRSYILDQFLINSSAELQEEIPGYYNELIRLRSNESNVGNSTDILRAYAEKVVSDLRIVAKDFPTDQDAQWRLRELSSIDNLGQTQDRLRLFARNTKQACIDFQQYFDWLKNAHKEFVGQLAEVKNDQLQNVLLEWKRFNFADFLVDTYEIYIADMRMMLAYRMKDITTGWSNLVTRFDSKISLLKNLVEQAAAKAIGRTELEELAVEEIHLAADTCKSSLDELLNNLKNARDNHLAELEPIYGNWKTNRFNSFAPTNIYVAPVAYMKNGLLVNQQVDNAFKVFNKY